MQTRRGRVFGERGERMTKGCRQQNGEGNEANQAGSSVMYRRPYPDGRSGKQVLANGFTCRGDIVASRSPLQWRGNGDRPINQEHSRVGAQVCVALTLSILLRVPRRSGAEQSGFRGEDLTVSIGLVLESASIRRPEAPGNFFQARDSQSLLGFEGLGRGQSAQAARLMGFCNRVMRRLCQIVRRGSLLPDRGKEDANL